MNKKQVLLAGFLGVLVIAMVVGFAAIVLPSQYVNEEVVATIMIVGAYALGGLIVLAVSREMQKTANLTLFMSIVSLIGYLTLIWFDRPLSYDTSRMIGNFSTSALIISFALVHRLLVLPLEERNTWGSFSKRAALLSAGTTACFLVFSIFFEDFWRWDDVLIRLLGVGVLITAGSSISIGAIAMFGPKPGEDEPDVFAPSLRVQMTCPSCANDIEVWSNRPGHCSHCKLQIEVRTVELRCECGYLLHQLEADICPECGKPVEAGDAWHKPDPDAATDTPP